MVSSTYQQLWIKIAWFKAVEHLHWTSNLARLWRSSFTLTNRKKAHLKDHNLYFDLCVLTYYPQHYLTPKVNTDWAIYFWTNNKALRRRLEGAVTVPKLETSLGHLLFSLPCFQFLFLISLCHSFTNCLFLFGTNTTSVSEKGTCFSSTLWK